MRAAGQSPSENTACPSIFGVQPPALHGLWRAEVDGAAAGTLLLEQHPAYTDSLSGEINRNGVRSRVAADLEDGEFTMEESTDGVSISATWIGALADGCAQRIDGTWQPAGAREARSFRLHRLAPR
jgi:hypothetical protein